MTPTPDPADLAGAYTFYHDGWRGWLRLVPDGERGFRGSYHDDRSHKDYQVTATVDVALPHRLELSIVDFNWMECQIFTGFVFRATRNGIAGWTVWGGDQKTYGFLARKTASLILSKFAREEEPVQPKDFGGRYSVYEDGRHGVMTLIPDAEPILRGTYRQDGSGRALVVHARIDPVIAHQIELVVDGPPGDARVFHGYLFSRPKNAIAGWAEVGGSSVGFYMTKLSPWPPLGEAQPAASGAVNRSPRLDASSPWHPCS